MKRQKIAMKRPLAVDLFSGCGGLTLGLKRAGFRVVGAVEIDDLAARTYRSNHGQVRVWNMDIRRLTAKEILRQLRLKKGRLDLLAGCPPCQGFSAIRRLNGARRIRDRRNELLFEFLRFVRVMRPKAVMLENVPRLAADPRMRRFRAALRRMGYGVNHQVLDAADYGVPQRRRRYVLLAVLGTTPAFAASSGTRKTVRGAFRGMKRPGRSGDRCHDLPETRSPRVRELIGRIPKDGGGRAALGDDDQLDCHKRVDGFRDVYGRMAWDDVAPTITGGCVNPSKGRFLHPSQNRAVTLREAAVLQGFPRRYRFELDRGKFAAAEMIGNALPPEFCSRHARSIMRTLVRKSSNQRT